MFMRAFQSQKVLLFVLWQCWVTPLVSGQTLYRVNAGGSAFTDTSTGNSWTSDVTSGLTISGSTGKYSVSSSKFSSSLAPMFSTERFSVSPAASFTYQFSMPSSATSSNITVALSFSENYASAFKIGFRMISILCFLYRIFATIIGILAGVFNVAINGISFLSNFDIFAVSGAGYTPVVRTVTIPPASTVSILFSRVSGHNDPKIDGIEISVDSTPTPTPTPSSTPTPIPSTTPAPTAPPSIDSFAAITALSWSALPDLGSSLGEVCNGIVTLNGHNVLLTMGQGSSTVYRYDIDSQVYLSNAAPRLVSGNHHAAEVFNNKLFVVGGFSSSNNAMNQVQIYDPVSNSWQYGANMPVGAGSPSAGRIGNILYTCGGIVPSGSGSTVNSCFTYDLVANTWTSMPSLIYGVNHAAAVSDGVRYFYVINGRSGGNVPSVGFNYNQRFDIMTQTWSLMAPSPKARGGMGHAVIIFGQIILLGGETTSSASATNGVNSLQTYYRCDVYNIQLNRWNVDASGVPLPLSTSQTDGGGCADMPVGMHGIYPVALGGSKLFISGGGVKMASSSSANVFMLS